jgi:hypothetical protein
MNDAAATITPSPAVRRFAWTQVRQALQQVVAVGESSPYLAAAWVMRPFQTVCIDGAYPAPTLRLSLREGSGTKFGTNLDPEDSPSESESRPMQRVRKLPGLDSNQQPSG